MKHLKSSLLVATLVLGMFLGPIVQVHAEETAPESNDTTQESEENPSDEGTNDTDTLDETETTDTEESQGQTESDGEEIATESTGDETEESSALEEELDDSTQDNEEESLEDSTPLNNSENSSEEITETVSVHIRIGSDMIFETEVTLGESTDLTIQGVSVPSNSILGVLYTLDQESDSFEINDLAYYEGFGSFLINCVNTPSLASAACYNWHYVVDGEYPFLGINQFILEGDEELYLYFGNTHQVVFSTSTIYQGESFTATSQYYEYTSNSWEPLLNVHIAVTQDNPLDPWSPIVVTSSSVDNLGQALFTLSATGTYALSIAEDYYYPTFSFEVLTSPTSNNQTGENNGGSGESCSSCNTTLEPELVSQELIDETISKILTYVKSQQKANGSIQDGATSDWLVMSFGAMDIYADTVGASTTLMDYVEDYNFSAGSELNLCAGYPRHVLALLAGGAAIDSSEVTTMLTKIKSNECFDGSVYGESGINDDIFALMALLATGESVDHILVNTLVEEIKDDQQTNGAFTWTGFAGADVTGAAINALSYASEKGASVEESVFTKAKEYLKEEQLNDGGWGFGTSDILTTSWAVMGINALGEGQSDWMNTKGKNPWHVLTSNLTEAGYYTSPFTGTRPDWFGMKHAVPALKGASWPIILQSNSSDNSTDTSCSTGCSQNSTTEESTETTTSTIQIPTSTEPLPEILILVPTTSTPEIDETNEETQIEEFSILPTTDESETSLIAPLATTARPSIQAEPTEKETTVTNKPTVVETDSLPEETIAKEEPIGKKIATIVFDSAIVAGAGVGLLVAWRFARTLL